MAKTGANSEHESRSCPVHLDEALDHHSFRANQKHRNSSFEPFKVEVQFIRDLDYECEYCYRKARWRVTELNG